jgi:integrase
MLTIYSAGLRGLEVINVKISDIDFERRTIHIRQSKYEKDRIVPLADCMAVDLKKYLKAENPHIWLFNGKEPDGRYSVRGLSRVMRKNLKAGKRQACGQIPGAIHPPFNAWHLFIDQVFNLRNEITNRLKIRHHFVLVEIEQIVIISFLSPSEQLRIHFTIF